MAHFNNANNASFRYTCSQSGEFEAYPYLGQAFSTGEVNVQADSYGQLSYSDQYWPGVIHQAQPYHPSQYSSYSSLANAVPAPSSVPLRYWGANQSGPSTNTFHTNVESSRQSSAGPNRTRQNSTGRVRPYGTSCACTNERRNAEAGPSTQVHPSVPYVGLPTLQPSGGISETTADAENYNTITEEDEVPTKRPRPHREQMERETDRLRKWVKRREGLLELPNINQALAAAVKIISTARRAVYPEPRLLTGRGKRTAKGSKAKGEFERRKERRSLLQELSRYYRLEQGKSGAWARQDLMSLVVQSLEVGSPLPGPSYEPPS